MTMACQPQPLSPRQPPSIPQRLRSLSPLGPSKADRLCSPRWLGISGQDFDIRDAGVTNQTAVRVYSQDGTLNLQAGGNDDVHVRNKIAVAVVSVLTDTGRMGLGPPPPPDNSISPPGLPLSQTAAPGRCCVMRASKTWWVPLKTGCPWSWRRIPSAFGTTAKAGLRPAARR